MHFPKIFSPKEIRSFDVNMWLYATWLGSRMNIFVCRIILHVGAVRISNKCRLWGGFCESVISCMLMEKLRKQYWHDIYDVDDHAWCRYFAGDLLSLCTSHYIYIYVNILNCYHNLALAVNQFWYLGEILGSI